MKAFLGIDGGGTKTKFTLCDQEGKILAVNLQPTSHYLQIGLEGVTKVLRDGTRLVCEAAGAKPADIVFAFIGCPGFGDTESATPAILNAVAQAMEDIPHAVGNDCENSLAGSLAGACGISLIAGTGSMGSGRNESGTFLRCGGWHHAIGSDEGSGFWISYQLLKEFTRQSDGRDEKTPLYQSVKDALEITVDGDVITRAVDEWNMDRTKVASLSRIITDLLQAEDPHATRIVVEAAHNLAEIAESLYRQLHFSGRIPVSYTGGIFNLGDHILSPLRGMLADRSMELCPPIYPPDIGSLILAFQYSGTPIPKSFTFPA